MDNKKILAINCSPRKEGNNKILLNSQKEKLEIIDLYDYNILPCRGCGNCESGKCILKDDFNLLIKKLDGFDRIIFATPVYRLNCPSLLYSFIERSSSLLLNNRNLKDKSFGIICIGGILGEGKINAATNLINFILSMEGIIIPPLVIGHADNPGEILEDNIAKGCFRVLIERMSKMQLTRQDNL